MDRNITRVKNRATDKDTDRDTDKDIDSNRDMDMDRGTDTTGHGKGTGMVKDRDTETLNEVLAISTMSNRRSSNYCLTMFSVKEITTKNACLEKLFFAEIVIPQRHFCGSCQTVRQF